MKIASLILVLSLSVAQAWAKTILISDIDDTIKNSHVLDKSEAFLNADKIANTVLGMSELYQAAHHTNIGLKIFYVSNAPRSLMAKNHRDFLVLNKYPNGSLRLRESLFQSDFKLKEIRKIMNEEKPDRVILVGDNGEKDVFIYENIVSEYPGTLFETYIHQAYSTLNRENRGVALAHGQIGFASALDLALQFRQQGLVSEDLALNFVHDFSALYIKENERRKDGPQAIPSWMDCRNFNWLALDSDLSFEIDYVLAKERILERCSHSALED